MSGREGVCLDDSETSFDSCGNDDDILSKMQCVIMVALCNRAVHYIFAL